MKKRMFGHPGLLVASLVIAFGLWLLIINTSNPQVTHTYTGVTVNITNASYVESRQQMYAMIDGIRTINVTVHTNRRLVERLSSSSITATAEKREFSDPGGAFLCFPAPVPVGIGRR